MMTNTDNIYHHIKKRETLSLDKAHTCINISQLCTFYFPDYPDSPTKNKVPMQSRSNANTNSNTIASITSKSNMISHENDNHHNEESSTKSQRKKYMQKYRYTI